MSPEGRQDALTVAPSNDSDGNLSLAVAWSSSWITRDHSNLPPYWLRLPSPPPKEEVGNNGSTSSDVLSEIHQSADDALDEAKRGPQHVDPVDHHSIRSRSRDNSSKAITCQISMSGLATAMVEENHYGAPTTMNLEGLYIDHLRTHPLKSDGVWFASAATAFGTSSQTILWNYKIPDEILSFARKETVPCGVLVVLGIVDESETPTWATKHNDYGADLQQFTKRAQEERAALAAESRLPPAQQQAAAQARRQKENQQRMDDSKTFPSHNYLK